MRPELKTCTFSVALVLASVVLGHAQDLVLTNGRIVTLDAASTVARALAIRQDTIVAVGEEDAVRRSVGADAQGHRSRRADGHSRPDRLAYPCGAHRPHLHGGDRLVRCDDARAGARAPRAGREGAARRLGDGRWWVARGATRRETRADAGGVGEGRPRRAGLCSASLRLRRHQPDRHGEAWSRRRRQGAARRQARARR